MNVYKPRNVVNLCIFKVGGTLCGFVCGLPEIWTITKLFDFFIKTYFQIQQHLWHLPCEKLPEKLRRYAPTEGNKEKREEIEKREEEKKEIKREKKREKYRERGRKEKKREKI